MRPPPNCLTLGPGGFIQDPEPGRFGRLKQFVAVHALIADIHRPMLVMQAARIMLPAGGTGDVIAALFGKRQEPVQVIISSHRLPLCQGGQYQDG